MAENKLTDACMPALSEALKSAPLSKLDLSGNKQITAAGWGALGDELRAGEGKGSGSTD